MITITQDQIQQIVDRLIAVEFATCAQAPRDVVEKAVYRWLNDHIDNLVADADWWVKNHGSDLKKHGLPYEDELTA